MKTFSFVLLVVVIACALVNASNMCSPVKYNGQTWSLNKPELLTGFFPSVYQNGTNGAGSGTWCWTLSLCDASLIFPGSANCTPPSYVSQGEGTGPGATPGCEVVNPNFLGVSYNGSLQMLEFRYSDPGASLQDTVYCSCNSTGTGLLMPTNTEDASDPGPFHQVFWTSSPACCPDGGPSPTSPAGNKCKPVSVNGKATIPFTEAAQLQGTFNGVNLEYNGQNINTNWQFSLCSTFADSNAKSGQAFITADVSGKNYFGEITAQPTFDQGSQQVMIKYSGFFDSLPMDLSVFVVCNPFQETLQMSENNVVVTQDPNTYLLSARINFVSAGACPRPN